MNILKAMTSARAATEDALRVLDALREAVAAKRQEISAIQSAPVTVDMALAAFDRWAAQTATDAVDRLGVNYLLHPSHKSGALTLPVAGLPGGGRDATPAAETLLGLVLLTGRVQVRQVIEGQLRDLLAGREAMTDSTRAKKLKQAEDELFEAGCSEEALIRTLEQAGVAVHRRADADPAVVLLHDDCLPR